VSSSPALLRVSNSTRGTELGDSIKPAGSFWARLKGLQLAAPLKPGHGLWLLPSGSVHTCFMRYPIDLVFLDAVGVVVDARLAVAPWRVVFAVRGTHSCLELPAGTVRDTLTCAGDQLSWETTDTAAAV